MSRRDIRPVALGAVRREGREPELDETYEATWMTPDELRGVTFYDPVVLRELG